MPFQKIRFLGGKLGEHLYNEFEVKSVGELEYISLSASSSSNRNPYTSIEPTIHLLA
jgi:hypothetical protein